MQDEQKFGKTSFLSNAGRYRAENLIRVAAPAAPDLQDVQRPCSTQYKHIVMENSGKLLSSMPHFGLSCVQVFGKGKDALLMPNVIYAMKQGKVTVQWLHTPLWLSLCMATTVLLCVVEIIRKTFT